MSCCGKLVCDRGFCPRPWFSYADQHTLEGEFTLELAVIKMFLPWTLAVPADRNWCRVLFLILTVAYLRATDHQIGGKHGCR